MNPLHPRLNATQHSHLALPCLAPLLCADQILSVRTWMNATCGIPLEDMVGMRDPYLINNPEVREVGG